MIDDSVKLWGEGDHQRYMDKPKDKYPELAKAVDAYDTIDSFLRNNLNDPDYAEYSRALEVVYNYNPS